MLFRTLFRDLLRLPRAQASDPRVKTTGLAAVTLGLGILALLAPLGRAEFPASRVGVLLAIAAAIEVLHALRRSTAAARRQAMVGAVISMAIAIVLIDAPFVAAEALRLLVAGWFAVDAIREAIAAFRARGRTERSIAAMAAVGNAAVVLLLLVERGWALTWGVAIAGALRICGIAWNIWVAPVYTTTEADETVVDDLQLVDQPEVARIAAELGAAEQARAPVDRSWTLAFIATLFAIHIGRMDIELTFLGLVSPAVAVLGDMFIAIAIALLILNPLWATWRRPTRWIERRLWPWYLGALRSKRHGWAARAAGAWLRWRLTLGIRMRKIRYSIPAALDRGLQSGLPLAAILAATIPVWGMNWFFDTENWAAGIWNSWAESRTDSWREAMVRAVLASEGAGAGPAPFAIEPPGIASGDFSFIVIGDTGEGDASQSVLRDQLLAVANRPDVRFVVVSSDVVYPTGAMKDYELKFWLPFKGVSVPVYAIPGNHDWYDALEAFNVTFLRTDAARTSIRARVEADLRMTSTTDARIEGLIDEAERLRSFYGVPTGFQRAPFFEIQTDRFALLGIDTGVLKSIDPAQASWLEGALERAAGKTTMAIVGHPFYAGGHDATLGDDSFASLKQLLIRHGVTIFMAGDTHDLEYYVEPAGGAVPALSYFVNGGGGAYLSFGTSLSWPVQVPTADWAYYPGLDAVTEKIEAYTPWWKRPAWWWTRQFSAWPFTTEWLSAAFDYNVSPFFQSFVEVRVERSTNRVRVIPYGVHGRLTWREFGASESLRAAGGGDRSLVEWTMPMPSEGTAP